jgi:sugar lactone lactonase YvrE
MPKPQILLSGLAIGESPRWHAGRLWFSNWGTQEIVAVDLDGNSEVVGHRPGESGGNEGTRLPTSVTIAVQFSRRRRAVDRTRFVWCVAASSSESTSPLRGYHKYSGS